jgi:hypothetical protein
MRATPAARAKLPKKLRIASVWLSAFGLAASMAAPAQAATTQAATSQAVTGYATGHHATATDPTASAGTIASHPQTPVMQAVAAARSTHHAVTITSDTSETSVTVAQPDGAVTSTQHVLPVRVHQHGRWVPVSATLRHAAAGRLAPAATPSGLTLSDGGRGALAVLNSPAGGTMSVTFPAPLPRPLVSGVTATYRGVLPGVDLRVTVTTMGGLSDELIVHNAVAAANPALRNLRLTTHVSGLKLGADRTGNLTATSPRGTTEFSGPPPLMWDSARTTAHSPRTATLPAQSSPAGPGRAAHATHARLASSAAGLTLTPAASLLTRKTAYPVYLANSITPDTFTSSSNATESKQNGFVETQGNSGCSSYKNWDVSFTYGNGAGYQDYAPCLGLYRSYYSIGVGNLDPSMHVQSATLYTWENYASDWTCSDTWPLKLYWASGIGSNTTWANPPTILNGGNALATNQVKPASNPNSSCGNQESNFDVTSIMQEAAANSWSNWDFGLWGDEDQESSDYGFMRVGDNPDVVTVFDLTPNVPTGMDTVPEARDTPGGADDPGCNQSGSWGWVGLNTSMALSVNISANITGEPVRAEYSIWDNQDNGVTIATPSSNWYTTSGTTDTPTGVTLEDGHQYGWDAFANVEGVPNGSDGGYSSARTVYCHFNVDLSSPNVPTVSSTDFPPSGSSPGTTKYAGQAGSFSFSASDPVPDPSSGPGVCTPGLCLSSGVAYFQYSLNTQIQGSANQVAATTSNGTATGTLSNLTIPDWGTNTLYVDAVDNAGNVSQAYSYEFYVPWNPSSKQTPGDVNGDELPDLLGTTTLGGLKLYPGNTDPNVLPVGASASGESPDGTTDWNDYQITHRGSMSGQGVDDLFALGTTGSTVGNLYLYRNAGGPSQQFANTGDVQPIYKPACTGNQDNPGDCTGYDTTNWAQTTQILAPGNLYTNGSPTALPSLLTVENGQLWAYQGTTYGSLTDPILLGASGGGTNWSQMTLIAPGLVNGTLTIWARDNATGAIYSYPVSVDGYGLPTLDHSNPSSPPTATSGTVITPAGSSLTSTGYPAVASPGPLDNSSYPGLYAEDSSGKLWYYPGQSGSQPLSGTPLLVGPLNFAVTQLS